MKRCSLFIGSLFLLAACSKELEEQPKSIAAETFYNTPTEVEAGLNAIYQPMKGPNCMGSLYPAQLESYADYMIPRGSYGILNTYAGLDNTNATRVGQIWQLFYQSILAANICINKIPEGNQLTDADKIKYIAEARFLRGLIYFIMVRNWDGVILRTEANIDSVNVKRSSAAETYALAQADLEYAKENLPLTARLIGAPSQWSARAVLTELYLWQRQYDKAKEEASAIIGSNQFSLVPVTRAADFEKVFGPEVVSTPEEIFYLKYSRQGANYGFTFAMFEHSPGDGRHGAGGYYAHYTDTALNNAMKAWDRNDLRKQYNWYPWSIGLGPHTVLPAKFSDPLATNANNAGNDYPLYKYSDVLLYFAEADNALNGGPTTAAVDALNQIRRRAYGYAPNTGSPVDIDIADYDASSFLHLVQLERSYETCDEAKRWLDLKRLGIALQTIQAAKGVTVADKFLLWPIPIAVEMTYNTALDPARDQNPGY